MFFTALASSTTPAPANTPAPTTPNHLPHNIREIVAYPPTPIPWLWIALIVGILVSATLLYLWLKKKKKTKNQPQIAIDPLTQLKDEIAHLRVEAPFHTAMQKEFFYQLSLGYRRFLELKTDLKATDQTLKELKQSLKFNQHFTEAQKKEIISFLEFSDYVKFAERHASMEVANTYHNQVLKWINEFDAIQSVSNENGVQT